MWLYECMLRSCHWQSALKRNLFNVSIVTLNNISIKMKGRRNYTVPDDIHVYLFFSKSSQTVRQINSYNIETV